MSCSGRLASSHSSTLVAFNFWILLACGAIAQPLPAVAEEPATDSVAKLVFEADLMKDIEPPLTLHYKVRMSGRDVQPTFMLSHSQYDPYNTDHMYATQVALECRMIAQAWGHNPGQKVLGAPQLYLFEPHQTEQMGWKPDTFLDITEVWDHKRAAIKCMEGQHHLWDYYTNVAQNRGNHFRRNSGGQAGGRAAQYAEGFQSVYPRTVDEL